MTPARSGIAFVLIIAMFIGASFLISLVVMRGGSLKLTLFQDIILSEGMVLLPALLIATVSGSEVGEIFRCKKIKPGTCILVVLFIFCLEPLVSAVNAFSLLFTDNVAADIAEQYINGDSNFMYVALIMAIIGPLAEELTFRGIIYAGLRKSGRLLGAIILQALLFGLMHLNFNQMSYAFVLGVAFGILNEVTNSLWPGIIGHFMINFGSVAGAFAIKKYMPEALAQESSRADLIYAFTFFIMLSVLFTGIAVLILIAISKHEPGGRFRLHRIFHASDLKAVTCTGELVTVKRPHVITVPVVIGIVIALVQMIAMLVMGM